MARPSTLRRATLADVPAIQAIYAPIVRETPISFEIDPPSVAEMEGRVAATLSAGFPYLVAEDGEGVAGYAYAGKFRERAAYASSVDVTAYVAVRARGRGVGRALYGDLLAQLAAAGVHTANAGITLPNAASVGLHEAMGFVKVGVFREVGRKFGAYHDVGWWQRVFR
ncbi:MAG: GNAT family N-acetyltransferase [Acuticoccus sp.]